VPFQTAEQGCQWLASELHSSEVLLVLDDVWQHDHLRLLNFATKLNCSHADSTLIVTTRDERVLQDEHGYRIDGLHITRPDVRPECNASAVPPLLLCSTPPDLEQFRSLQTDKCSSDVTPCMAALGLQHAIRGSESGESVSRCLLATLQPRHVDSTQLRARLLQRPLSVSVGMITHLGMCSGACQGLMMQHATVLQITHAAADLMQVALFLDAPAAQWADALSRRLQVLDPQAAPSGWQHLNCSPAITREQQIKQRCRVSCLLLSEHQDIVNAVLTPVPALWGGCDICTTLQPLPDGLHCAVRTAFFKFRQQSPAAAAAG
jgi:hypothetical protein